MKDRKKLNALKCAFPKTVPILTGFLFLGASYGVYMRSLGFSFLYPTLMALTVFGGSLEFVAADLLTGAFQPLSTFAAALMIQARHLFYGVSMLDKYKNTGLKKPYLIFGLCDESFSVNYTAEAPAGVDRGWFMFFVTLLNQLYWVTGAALGGLLGEFLPFSVKGIEFVMTAMFTVIFIDQWKKETQHISSLTGLGVTLLSLALFGADRFLLPAMAGILAVLTVFRRPIERAGDAR